MMLIAIGLMPYSDAANAAAHIAATSAGHEKEVSNARDACLDGFAAHSYIHRFPRHK